MVRRLSAVSSAALASVVLATLACVEVDRSERDQDRNSRSSRSQVQESGRLRLDQSFAGRDLDIDVRSGEVEIRGGEPGKVVVHCGGRDRHRCDEVTARLSGGDLRIAGGPNHIDLRIEVPSEIGLRVHMPAGELSIDGIRGDKDVRLNAGELRITSPDPKEYGTVDARLLAGEISAEAFGGRREGVLRKFSYHGDGPYRLSARLLAGEMSLR